MPAADRPLRLTKGEALASWFERTDVEAWKPVVDALLAVQDRTWAVAYEWFEELTKKQSYVLVIEEDLWLVWYVIATYPDYYAVAYLGHPDDYTAY